MQKPRISESLYHLLIVYFYSSRECSSATRDLSPSYRPRKSQERTTNWDVKHDFLTCLSIEFQLLIADERFRSNTSRQHLDWKDWLIPGGLPPRTSSKLQSSLPQQTQLKKISRTQPKESKTKVYLDPKSDQSWSHIPMHHEPLPCTSTLSTPLSRQQPQDLSAHAATSSHTWSELSFLDPINEPRREEKASSATTKTPPSHHPACPPPATEDPGPRSLQVYFKERSQRGQAQ